VTTDPGLREAARQLGISHPYLAKLAREKRVPRNKNGTFNVEAVRAKMAAITDPAMVRTGGSSRVVTSGNSGPVTSQDPARPVVTPDDAREAVSLISRILQEEGHTDPGTLDYDAVRIAETILKARERDLKIAERKKQLVNLERVKQHVFGAARLYRNVMLQIPTRHAAQIAAVVGCNTHELERELTRVIRETLMTLSEPVIRP
jgi:hypothetical protein